MIKFFIWIVNGHIGRHLSVKTPLKVSVIITYYHPIRMKYISNQIRNLLKCDFVDKVVISNHNPEEKIEERVAINDNRLVYINQSVKRSCGYRWHIAKALEAEYIISIDDDILLFPSQLKTLFLYLINNPNIPHGFSGIVKSENEEFHFREREDISVHYLCEVFAVTKEHIECYFKIKELLAKKDKTLPEIVEDYGDFIVISQSGSQKPRIHRTSKLFRSDTFKTSGIAMHKDNQWKSYVMSVVHAIGDLEF